MNTEDDDEPSIDDIAMYQKGSLSQRERGRIAAYLLKHPRVTAEAKPTSRSTKSMSDRE